MRKATSVTLDTHGSEDRGPDPSSVDAKAKRAVGWFEILLVVFVLAGAAALRLYRVADYPPGLHYDEAIDLWAGLRIAEGQPMLYLQTGWGREVLFYYILAAVLRFSPDNIVALRVAAILCSTAVMLTAYALFRQKVGVITAWFALAWYGVLFWSVFMSRAGNRAITLPLLLNLMALAFWWAWDALDEAVGRRRWGYAAAGFFLGGAFYTYQPSRFVPFMWLAFFGYVFLFHRDHWRRDWRLFLVMAGMAALIAAPMVYVLLSQPGLESARQWTIEPFTQLMQGNLRPVLENVLATLKMFTIRGDPLVTYNVPFRPLFVPAWGGIFFYVGLALAVARWRRPFYAFILLWMGVMLAPTILTISAPNHPRMIGALPPIVLLAGLAVGEGVNWLRRYGRAIYALPLLVAGVAAVIVTGRATAEAYYIAWPISKEADFLRNYNVYVSAVIADLASSPTSDRRPVAISSHSIEDIHPTLVQVTLERDLDVRWIDATQAFVLPSGGQDVRFYITRDYWVDSDLSRFLDLEDLPAHYTEQYSLLEVALSASRIAEIWAPRGQTVCVPLVDAISPVAVVGPACESLPAVFGDQLQLNTLTQLPALADSGEVVTLITAWEVLQGGHGRPLSFFVHLLDIEGQVVAQQDTFGYPLHSWQRGDLWLQVHHVFIPRDLAEGTYWVQLGVYERLDGRRWTVSVAPATDGALSQVAPLLLSDRLILGSIEVGGIPSGEGDAQ